MRKMRIEICVPLEAESQEILLLTVILMSGGARHMNHEFAAA